MRISLWYSGPVALVGLFMVPFVFAAVQQDQMVNGGGAASTTGYQLSWTAVAEPLGGRMSGGDFIMDGGGAPPPAGNQPPAITSFTPANNSRCYKQDVITLSVTATDAENDALQYRFLVDGVVIRDWATQPTMTWNTTNSAFSWRTLRVEVKDPTHTVYQENRAFIFWRPPVP